MASTTRSPQRKIPKAIEREVRRRCGFGCVICGMPLFEYDHMTGWAQTHQHDPNDITLLCDRHHREKTAGLLPIEAVRQANADPINLRSGTSPDYELHFSGRKAQITIGNNLFQSEDMTYGMPIIPVCIDSLSMLMFSFEDERLLLSLFLYDEEERLILQIDQNQLVYSMSAWDITLIGKRLTIRDSNKSTLIDIGFFPPFAIHVEHARFIRHGIEILVSPSTVICRNTGAAVRGAYFKNCVFGFIAGEHVLPGSAGFNFGSPQRKTYSQI